MLAKMVICVFILILHTGDAFTQVRTTEANKNYHLIYLDISRAKDRQNLTLTVMNLLDGIYQKSDDFLLFLSNGYKPELLFSAKDQKLQQDNIISMLQTLKPSQPVLMFDKDTILNIWDVNDIKSVTVDNKIQLLYKNIYLHYFISADLFKLEEEELIDRLLLVKDLTRKHIDPARIIIEINHSKDDAKGFIDRKGQLADKNETGYTYIFKSY